MRVAAVAITLFASCILTACSSAHFYFVPISVRAEFGPLKHDDGLGPLRARGVKRVALHADLTMVARGVAPESPP